MQVDLERDVNLGPKGHPRPEHTPMHAIDAKTITELQSLNGKNGEEVT